MTIQKNKKVKYNRKDRNMKAKSLAAVVSQKEIAENIFDMWIETDLAKEAHPGAHPAFHTMTDAIHNYLSDTVPKRLRC